MNITLHDRDNTPESVEVANLDEAIQLLTNMAAESHIKRGILKGLPTLTAEGGVIDLPKLGVRVVVTS